MTEAAAAPALPDGMLLQLFLPETGERYRIAEDGRFLAAVGGAEETERRPMSKYEKGRERISSAGLDRLRAALDEADFFSLPETVPMNDCIPEGTIIKGTSRKVRGRPLVFSARRGDDVHTVETTADLAARCTLGPLRPVYDALDLEALGDWMNE